MGSKYTEAFDSLKSDDKIRQERTERILAAQNADHDIQQEGNGAASAVKVRGKFFAGNFQHLGAKIDPGDAAGGVALQELCANVAAAARDVEKFLFTICARA